VRDRLEAQRGGQLLHRLVLLGDIAVQAIQVLAARPFDQFAHQLAAQALADQEAADQDRVLGFAGAGNDRGARARTHHGFTGGQGLGRDQGDFALGIRVGQALRRFRRQFGHRLQETVADLFGAEQTERGMQRRAVFGPDGADQQLVATGCLENLVPGRHAVTGSHTGDSLVVFGFSHPGGSVP